MMPTVELRKTLIFIIIYYKYFLFNTSVVDSLIFVEFKGFL